MKAKLLLRLAAVLTLIHLLGHSVGHSTWDKPEDQKMQQVVTTMKSYRADFMGATKSMADYYNGYSLMIFGLFGMAMVMIWFASSFIYENRTIAQKVLVPIGITFIFFGVVEFIFFFPFAASMSLLTGIATILGLSAKK